MKNWLFSNQTRKYEQSVRKTPDFLTKAQRLGLTKAQRLGLANTQRPDFASTQRPDFASTQRYDCRSSNGQIRRVLGLTQSEVDSLFPEK